MSYPFSGEFRQFVSSRCASFPTLDSGDSPALKRAAVAIAICAAENGEDAAILLTKRAEALRAHSGQWALPGGRCDEGETPQEAALRELEEELGLALGRDAVLGLLDDYPTRSGYLIKPAVVWTGANADVRPNPHEVASVHRVPIAYLSAPGVVSFISIPESERPVIRIRLYERYVHAPTAAVIHQFVELIEGRVTRVRDYEQPVFAWK
jgi:8-oxo-dGTP pyrophosphatase MutT (NUDIX family)